jgi:hypothetical protein
MVGATRRLAIVVPALVAAVGCGVGENVVAEVGDRQVNLQALQGYLDAATGMSWQTVDDSVASRLFDQFLDQEVLALTAERRGMGVMPVDPADRSARVRWLIEDLCGPVPPVDERMVELGVAARAEERRPARAHLRQMLLVDLETARRARSRLERGEAFELVSKEESRAPNAAEGGELGYLSQGTLPEGLDEVVFSLSPGEFSEPVQSPSGYHIFQVLELVPEGPATLAEIEASVHRGLADEAKREHVRGCVDERARDSGVRVHQDHLWFRYDGRYGEKNDGS